MPSGAAPFPKVPLASPNRPLFDAQLDDRKSRGKTCAHAVRHIPVRRWRSHVSCVLLFAGWRKRSGNVLHRRRTRDRDCAPEVAPTTSRTTCRGAQPFTKKERRRSSGESSAGCKFSATKPETNVKRIAPSEYLDDNGSGSQAWAHRWLVSSSIEVSRFGGGAKSATPSTMVIAGRFKPTLSTAACGGLFRSHFLARKPSQRSEASPQSCFVWRSSSWYADTTMRMAPIRADPCKAALIVGISDDANSQVRLRLHLLLGRSRFQAAFRSDPRCSSLAAR